MIRRNLIAKINPVRFEGLSPKMAAVVGYVVGERFTTPAIEEIAITTDECIIARLEQQTVVCEQLGPYRDVERNLIRLATTAGLSPDERRILKQLFEQKVGRRLPL